MPTLDITSWGQTVTCQPEVDRYGDGRLALSLLYFDEDCDCWFPHCRVTTNLPNEHLNEGEFFIKDWAENEPIVHALIQAGWLESTGREVQSGYIFPKVMRAAGPLADYLKEATQ